MISNKVNEVEKTISVDQRHYGAIIGANGEKVKQFQEDFNVQIIFPSSSKLLSYYSFNDNV